MNQKTTIQIFCTINPSEDPDKVKTAVNNIFPDVELEISDTEISVGLEEIIGLADESIENNNVTIDEMVSDAIKIFQKWIE